MKLSETDVVLVTGGASGLGRATVEAAVATGAHAVIVDLHSSPGSQLADQLGDAAIFVPADVRNEGDVQAAVEAATNVGVLRVVVNCAGVATPGRVIGKRGVLPLTDFRTVIDINLVGTFNVLRIAAAAMIDNEPLDGDRGLVVMTASVAAYDGQIGQAAYAASKGGIVQMTKAMATAWARENIQVNAVLPGWIDTDLTRKAREQVTGLHDKVVARTPAGRWGSPEDHAGIAVFLASAGSDFVTGTAIPVDGGYSVQGV